MESDRIRSRAHFFLVPGVVEAPKRFGTGGAAPGAAGAAGVLAVPKPKPEAIVGLLFVVVVLLLAAPNVAPVIAPLLGAGIERYGKRYNSECVSPAPSQRLDTRNDF